MEWVLRIMANLLRPDEIGPAEAKHSYLSIPALVAAPLVFLALFSGKIFTKIFGLVPVIGAFRSNHKERWYYTLLMSTGLTFGTISALFGLSHGIVTQEQYSHLVAVVIGSAVVPTMIAGAWFLPRPTW